MRSKQHGFTLVELLIVMVLLVVLASIALPTYTNSVRRAREATLKEDLYRMRDAMDQYYADKNKWPAALQDLVSEGYLREIPKDPFTNSADTWQVDNAEPDPNNPASEPGVDDVHSGSEETSTEGSKYSEWD
jgi:general secretion pathway protein G